MKILLSWSSGKDSEWALAVSAKPVAPLVRRRAAHKRE
jgi:hypothetical protein